MSSYLSQTKFAFNCHQLRNVQGFLFKNCGYEVPEICTETPRDGSSMTTVINVALKCYY